jgi:hypothetical protein
MNKLFSCKSSKNLGTLVRVCGLYFGFNVWGNCFSPAICVNTNFRKSKFKTAKVILTLRWSGAETIIYWRGGLLTDWNSEHIARKFGKEIDAPHGICFRYHGWLGNHHDI